MSDYIAFCSDCDHVWVPRQAPDEIDQPRCSDCDATGRSILFEAAADVADAVQRSALEPELVRAAKRERRWLELRQRLGELLDRLEQTAPSDTDYTAAREVRGPFWEANKLSQLVDDRGPEISLEELNAVSDRVDELEAEVGDDAPALEIVGDLQSSIEERREEQERLQTLIETLEEEEYEVDQRVTELQHEYTLYSRRLEGIEDEMEALDYGHDAGKYWGIQEAQIEIPCVVCGEAMVMEPGSDMHRVAIQALRFLGWHHTHCQQSGWVSAEDFSSG